MKQAIKRSFVELSARERAVSILDQGTFRELLDPFDRIESPHLLPQGIVPQSDDGVVVARGRIDGEPAVVLSIEGSFQGGGIGEVSGAKIAGALELALHDNERGVTTRPVVIFDTGGVRLQEANHGLLAISEMIAAVVALRRHVPVVGVIPGKVGCFGGMSITASLFTTLIMTREGRFGLNGPEVIEQEAGIEELDSCDRQRVWDAIGATRRHGVGFIDELVADDVDAIGAAIRRAFAAPLPKLHRTEQVEEYQSLLSRVDPTRPLDGATLEKIWAEPLPSSEGSDIQQLSHSVEGVSVSRGRIWLKALTGMSGVKGEVPSVQFADAQLNGEPVRFISVVPNPSARFPRARHGEVGLEEGWAIAKVVRQAMEEDRDGHRRAIVAIVDVPSQAYGYREELLGISYACAAAADAYASARMAGHPVIALIVGKAISGAFLAHGFQANRLLALNDEGVQVHAMSKPSAARITRRSIEELEEVTRKVPSMAYDIQSFATLGALDEQIDGIDADQPRATDIQKIQAVLTQSIADIRANPSDLSRRVRTEAARSGGRRSSIQVRKLLQEQWETFCHTTC
ncbi:biotin-independent malonate decarboxylase subunit beta [Desmospora activa]|uniref:Malonate decarboxylase beta subunit n=1 Tax=Desmospora activa DSM 45169 TaxID=1121389 RepID=A0A2T4Z4N4_9BACL|nr:biotin-independent malonate decarboxylase subunit beta [Desmospora activa]PTM56854.1 malonate decarboxylase beta subunit [Desmospora activa DSM 45169]